MNIINKKVIFIFFTTLTTIVIVILFILELTKVQNFLFPPKPSPTPTSIPTIFITPNPPIPGQSEEYKRGAEKALEEEKSIVIRLQNIITLRNFLPYEGVNFSLSYNIRDDSYILTLENKFIQEGEKEFEKFLKKYNVEESDITIRRAYR